MSANVSAINPSTNLYQVFATLSIPVCYSTHSANKFEAMADLQSPDIESILTLKNIRTGKKLNVSLQDDPEVEIGSVMDAETEEELISFDSNGKMDDPDLEDDIKAGLLLPMPDDNKRKEPSFEVNLPQSIINKLQAELDKLYADADKEPRDYGAERKVQGFEKCLSILGLTLSYNKSKDGEQK
ncbi:MAG: hypothetical protein ABF651_01700 [Sporolactobacillus sp.]